jgi:EAL domain-containing protein (putative c-di-GMP-specific phosphodiesterase class I)/FixJ family two-component response regulator
MSRPRVLIVDDDEQICFVATRALESIAFCDSAHDVPQALRALNRNPYDVVLVDLTLPGPSGMTLLDELRRQWPQTAAIVLSGLTDLSVARDASSRGALGYVVKPFRVRDLRIQVTAALGRTQRSANAAWASARAQIVATLDGLLGTGEPIACVVADIEHVPLLSATYGDAAIERLRDCIEQRLREFGPSIGVIGQLGPATFVASLSLPDDRGASQAARSLFPAVSAPVVFEGQRLPVAARLGVAVASPGEAAESVLNLAEGAAGAARDSALPFVVYDGDLRDTARDQLELLADAASAIQSGGLHVAYQAQRELANGAFVGVEALARWRHPERGDIPASVFVPLAERMGLVDELGKCVLRTACTDLRRLRREPLSSDLRVSVNVSTTELRDLDYPNRVARALGDADLPAEALRLEITESLALDESDEVRKALDGIQDLGVRLSVDDFGTGYSSFASLTSLPWAEVKLDRSLTEQCLDVRGREMLRAIVAFGKAVDVEVIAEGIETREQLDTLRDLGCRYGQGYLLGRPAPIASIARDLSRTAA